MEANGRWSVLLLLGCAHLVISVASEVNPAYTAWSDWEECSLTCAVEIQHRTRSCSNPAPTSDVVTTPVVTTPVVTTPEVTTPVVTTPEVTTPVVTTPELTTEVTPTDAGPKSERPHWGYFGQENVIAPNKWRMGNPICGQKRQSPINIKTQYVDIKNRSVEGDITFTEPGYTGNFTVTNNGHSVQVNIPDDAGITVSAPGLTEVYKLAQFHFHWGSNATQGSEHTIDGVRYPLEVHFVTFKASLGDLKGAADKDNGLAVFSGLFEISETVDDLAQVSTLAQQVIEPGSSIQVPGHGLKALIPVGNFYNYPGSLTTPPCYQSVNWYIFQTKLRVSEESLAAFRSLETEHGEPLEDNFRPVQPLNGRTVHFYQ